MRRILPHHRDTPLATTGTLGRGASDLEQWSK
jgi:hypothetical protein